MSTYQHHGALQQRRLSKLYSDTKQSCERAILAPPSKANPESDHWQQDFQYQKDRLIAWGLDWTESNEQRQDGSKKALPDDPLETEDFARILSTIQTILDRYEDGYQQRSDSLLSDTDNLGLDSKVEAHRVNESGLGVKPLVSDLTTCIDALFELSAIRKQGFRNPGQAQPEKPSLQHYDLLKQHYSSYTDNVSKRLEEQLSSKSKSWYPSPTTSRPGFDFGDPFVPQNENVEQFSIQESVSQHRLYIDRNALELAPGHQSDVLSPPTYEDAVAPSHTRVVGRLSASSLTAEQVAAFIPPGFSYLPVTVEMISVNSGGRGSAIMLPQQKVEVLAHQLDNLLKKARTTHVGILKFLGYFVDIEFSQVAFIYELPTDDHDALSFHASSGLQKPKSLASVISSPSDGTDLPTPHLEDRLRMAYNLALSVMHLHSNDIVHGAINSKNVVFLQSGYTHRRGDPPDTELRTPYLTSLASLTQIHSRSSPEPFSASIYRHPTDKRSVDSPEAWAYDLYSLGLILLEIGLWTPLSRLWKAKYDNAMFMSRIKKVYAQKLGSRCGTLYMKVVQNCLSMPEYNSLEAERGPLLPRDVRSKTFTFDILQDIARCCTLDLGGPSTVTDVAYFQDLHRSIRRPSEATFQTAHESSEILPDAPMTPQSLAEDIDISRIIDETPATGKSKSKSKSKSEKALLKKWDDVAIPQEHLDEWNMHLMPRLSKFLQRVLGDSPESCGASLMMFGKSPKSAKTTICIQCSSVDMVRAALKQGFRCRNDWGVVVVGGEVRRSKHPKRRRRRTVQRATSTSQPSSSRTDSFYQEKPQSGASIGAFRDDEHLPPVSFGGTILVDGEPFGMTVHHMLDSPSDDEEEEEDDDDGDQTENVKRSAMPAFNLPESDDEDCPWSSGLVPPEALYPFEIDDADSAIVDVNYFTEDEPSWFCSDDGLTADFASDIDPDDYDDSMSVGDTVGVDPLDEEDFIITQPAIDDVEEDFFPNADDRDDDHLASHSLGHVYASSGIRRSKREGIKHEIDWALIKIQDHRLNIENTISSSSNQTSPKLQKTSRRGKQRKVELQGSSAQESANLSTITPLSNLSGLAVQCCGRTSGLQNGRISRAMALVKMHGRRSFSSSWCADGGFGVPGDSGAWVFDPSTRQLCGHVLAWGDKSQTAYIAPMQVLFDDIARSLGAHTVELPCCSVSDAEPVSSIETVPLPFTRTRRSTELDSAAPNKEKEDTASQNTATAVPWKQKSKSETVVVEELAHDLTSTLDGLSISSGGSSSGNPSRNPHVRPRAADAQGALFSTNVPRSSSSSLSGGGGIGTGRGRGGIMSGFVGEMDRDVNMNMEDGLGKMDGGVGVRRGREVVFSR
ncbi:MAG: hypothetical protein Q9227_003105 [Pyrenula ochraceoflavens]